MWGFWWIMWEAKMIVVGNCGEYAGGNVDDGDDNVDEWE